MTKTICTILVACTLSLSIVPAFSHEGDFPEIDIDFSGLIEFGICERFSGSPVESDAIDELVNRLDEFAEYWADRGPRLLLETVAVTGQPFSFHERQAILHLCPGITSMSMPLLINVRAFIEAIDEETRPMWLYVSIVYHEVLHHYLVNSFRDSFDWVLGEFSAEPPVVRNHLILMALEHRVYSRLGLTAELAELRDFYMASELHGRALAIVDEKGVEYFLEQILD